MPALAPLLDAVVDGRDHDHVQKVAVNSPPRTTCASGSSSSLPTGEPNMQRHQSERGRRGRHQHRHEAIQRALHDDLVAGDGRPARS